MKRDAWRLAVLDAVFEALSSNKAKNIRNGLKL
ncbi:hypothetical protein SPSIL_009410 [Sporomusa silvacetica DSM 10669]|uniref:Uncharacterized protein n=1 Tax=Sporomusa silvacetica DSM 10669 TaxID=1123289 RepID=A0ABZ3IGM1_9FIRM|nr:hypothetical protein SPSIL_55550 [Sporomusa silvacetica DSM 10669]